MILKHPKTEQAFLLVTNYAFDNPYHGTRRTARSIKAIVVHHTAGSTAGDLSILRGRTTRKVSVKYLVADPSDGNYRDSAGRLIIWQLLAHDVIGWSIGETTGTYGWVENANSDSIEISNLGTGSDAFERDQIEAVEALIAFEEDRCGRELAVFGHREVSPGRKIDPYKSFPLVEVKDLAAWHKVGMETLVERTHAAIAITDLGDKTFRGELKALAAKWDDTLIEAATQVLVHTSLGPDADAFIAYARARGLSETSITVDGPSVGTMVVRNAGIPAPIDTVCIAELAAAKVIIAKVKSAIG